MHNNNNLSCKLRIPGTSEMTFPVQIVNNSHSRGYRGRRSTSKSNTHKIIMILNKHSASNLHEVNSLEVRFTKFARAVFRNPILDL